MTTYTPMRSIFAIAEHFGLTPGEVQQIMPITALLSERDIFRPEQPQSDAMSTPDVEAYVVHDENATVAVVTVYGERGAKAEFTGSSKRIPGDPRNRTAAEQIALGRALVKAGSALFSAGYSNAG